MGFKVAVLFAVMLMKCTYSETFTVNKSAKEINSELKVYGPAAFSGETLHTRIDGTGQSIISFTGLNPNKTIVTIEHMDPWFGASASMNLARYRNIITGKKLRNPDYAPKSYLWATGLSLVSTGTGYLYAGYNNPYNHTFGRWLFRVAYFGADVFSVLVLTGAYKAKDAVLTMVGWRVAGLLHANYLVIENNTFGSEFLHPGDFKKPESISYFKYLKRIRFVMEHIKKREQANKDKNETK